MMIPSILDNISNYHELYITKNANRSSYESMEEYLEEDYIKEFISPEERKKCIESNCIWEIQLYPRTSISFYKSVASTFEKALEIMLENYIDGKWI